MLPDSTRLLPTQVIIVAGLTEAQLKERRRLDPPKPPHPLPREKGLPGLWYALGELRAYLASIREQAEVDAELGRRPFERKLRFSAWLGQSGIQTTWPCALIGQHGRPVDIFATIRDEVSMSRNDKVVWLNVEEFLAELLRALKEEAAAAQIAIAKSLATRRLAAGMRKGDKIPSRRNKYRNGWGRS